MLKRFSGLVFLCKPTANQFCCTSSHDYGEFVFNGVCSCLKRAEVTTLCCGWTGWVLAFERHRSGYERSVIRALNLIFRSILGFCEIIEFVLNTNSVLHSQFTKETQHIVIKSKNQRISENNRLYSKSL